MSLAPELSTSAASDLQTVSIVCLSKWSETRLWVDALKNNGAEMLEDEAIQSLQDITRQKLAVIFDQKITDLEKYRIIQKYESLHEKDVVRSLRFFECIWSKETSADHDRLRIINLMNIAPDTLPAHVNRALFKSRLPAFLRKHYDVDISDVLEEIEWIHYRPITVRAYKKNQETREIDYETNHLYIHDKRLYIQISEASNTLVRVSEGDKVWIQKYGSKIKPQLAHLTLLKNETEEE